MIIRRPKNRRIKGHVNNRPVYYQNDTPLHWATTGMTTLKSRRKRINRKETKVRYVIIQAQIKDTYIILYHSIEGYRMTTSQPQKWKQYGGMNKLDTFNNITVNSIVADTFTLKKSYYGTFDICGELHVSGNAIIDTNITGSNLTITNDISANRLFVKNKSTHYADMDVSGNLTVYNGNAHFYKNVDVSFNLYLSKQLFLGNSQLSFINATDTIGNIGINTTTPI